MRTAFVLGGTGFVGRAISRVLRDAGWSVTVGRRTSEPLPEDIEGSVGDVVALDRNDDDELAAGLGEGVDVLVDTIPYRARDGSQLVAMKDRVGSLIAISTVSVYSDDDQRSLDEAGSAEEFPDFPVPILETQVTVTPGDQTYSTRKAVIEEALLQQDDLPATVIRPGAIYGPHDTQCREWFFVKRILDRRPVVILGYGGRTVFHPTSVANLAELVRLAAEKPGTRVLNCGDPSPPDALGIERCIAAAMGHEWTEVLVPPRLALTSVGRTPWSGPKSVVLDMNAAREELGYRPITSYPEAVGEVCDWVTAATQDLDWRAVLPRAAEYLGTRFATTPKIDCWRLSAGFEALKGDESCVRGHEPAGVKVEGPQVVVEVDVQPLASGGTSLGHGNGNQFSADSVSSNVRADHGVEHEGMDAAVPRHVDETDELDAFASANPPETVVPNLGPPVVFQGFMVEALGMQCIYGRVLEVTAPFVRVGHQANVTQ